MRSGDLRKGRVSSCGCLKSEMTRKRNAERLIDILGQRFGRLIVVGHEEGARWRCECDCGIKIICLSHNLRSGGSQSCGCLMRELASERVYATTHGMTDTREWGSWRGMHKRCYDPKATGYKNYGGRGVVVCERWKSFENFFEDMGVRPKETTLDRIDNNGNYEPNNCRWATWVEQSRNRRNTRYIEFEGEVTTFWALAELVDISPGTLWRRYQRGDRETRLVRPTGLS